MKKQKNKLKFTLSILIIGFLISTSYWNIQNIKAYTNNETTTYEINVIDRFGWKWNKTEVVSVGIDSGFNLARMAIDSKSNIHVVWEETADWDILYCKLDALTSSWGPIQIISTESTDGSANAHVTVDSKDNVHIVWEDNTNYVSSGTDFDIFFKMFNATLQSWTSTKVVSTESTLGSIDAYIDVDEIGNIHVVWTDYTDIKGCGVDADVFYKVRNATTSLWEDTEVVSTVSSLSSEDPSMAVDSSGNIFVVWEDDEAYMSSGSDTDVFYREKDTNSQVWSSTSVLSESSDSSYRVDINIDSADNRHIAWNSVSDIIQDGSDVDIYYKGWNAVTFLWEPTEIVSTESNSSSYRPSLAADFDGNIHVVWQDSTLYSTAGPANDIFYKRLEKMSSLWTPTEIVSTESTGTSDMSNVAIDSIGRVHVVWRDYTNYTNCGTDTDVFYKLLSGTPLVPDLAIIAPNPTEITNVYLDWNDVVGATKYYVYRSTSYIDSIEGLSVLFKATTSESIDTLPDEGHYYYVVVAENFVGQSAISNCQYIEYTIPHLREFGIISSIALSLLVISIVILKKRKNKVN